jgi:hypothetical protein
VRTWQRLWRASVIESRARPAAIRLTIESPTQQHITIPAHDSLKVGTLAAILSEVASHLKIDREELQDQIFS